MPNRTRLLPLVLLLALTSCASPSVGMSAGAPLGVRQGGAQDIGAAREQVQAGRVPPPEAFTFEGLFAEHDLPVGPPAPGKTISMSLGLGIAPLLPEGKSATFVQLGMGSAITAGQFQRPKL